MYMKRTACSVVLLALCLALAACGPRESAPETASLDLSAGKPAPDISRTEPGGFQTDSSQAADGSLPPLTEEDKAAARDAAIAYYQSTVFRDIALTEIEPRWGGEVSFQISCTKGGVKQDPDRTISLERRDGVWTVVNEGY